MSLFVPAVRPAGPATASRWIFRFAAGELLLPDTEPATLTPLAAAADDRLWPDADQPASSAPHYLGQLDGHDCWALKLDAVPAGWRGISLRAALMSLDATLAAIAGRAAQVLEWDRSHRYCGACGTPTELRPDERARHCPACGLTTYPRISPVAMALIWRPGELLLARSPHFPKGRYSALAGFVEAGESLEECLHREVMEEVGVSVTDLRYFGSQSWPFPHSLMVAFTCRWVDGEIVPQPGEIEDAQWFGLEALPDIPPAYSVAGRLIRGTVEGLVGGGVR